MRYFALLIALVASSVFAADPKLSLDKQFGRDRAIVASIEDLPAGESAIKWSVRDLSGKVKPDLLVLPDKLCVWAPPGSYEVVCLIFCPDWDKRTYKFYDLQVTFSVVDGVAPPPPSPPSGDFSELTKQVVVLAGPVVSQNKAAEAAKLAGVFRTHGKMATEGKYGKPQQLADACAAEYVAELGLNNYLRWRPMLTRLREELSELMPGKLPEDNMKAWGSAWEAIGQGFDEVASAKEPVPKQ